MKPVLTATNLKGNVIHVDGRGNLYTNIHLNDIEAFSLGKRFRIVLSRHEHINKMVTHAGEVEPGDTACFISDQNLLTICVNRGNASRLLGLEKGSHVLLEK
jgi:S-adenosylmethionine hydrolase